MRSSVAGSKPYPDLTSIVVTPQPVSSRALDTALRVSSSSEAALVARTVDMMPTPARAIRVPLHPTSHYDGPKFRLILTRP